MNINIELLALPCDIVSLDAQDIMGTHFVNLGGALTKQRMDKDGKLFGEPELIDGESPDGGNGHAHDQSRKVDFNRVVKAFKDKEGCILKGFMLINKVPGNFHLSSHAFS